MYQKDSAMQTKDGRLVVPEAWEAYASRVMAELLSQRYNRTVKAVKKASVQETGKPENLMIQ